jgi:hypothetical protein
MAEGALDTASASPLRLVGHTLDPRTYWSAFKLWTHPYPFHDVEASESRRFAMAMTVMALWLLLVGAAIAAEHSAKGVDGRSGNAREVAGRRRNALSSNGFGAWVMVAASPVWVRELRPHLALVLTSCLILIGGYALLALARRYPALDGPRARGAAVALVLATAFGAQTNLLRGYVDPRSDQLDFIRTELTARRPSAFDRIVVILPPRGTFCASEPCDPYTGRITHNWWHARRPERYRYALSTLGIDPGAKTILFVEGAFNSEPEDLLVDWRKFYRARKRTAQESPAALH